jgi:NAD(P)-dependent dehydrogenase (short-subunit alcohol dehydrogenase family)
MLIVDFRAAVGLMRSLSNEFSSFGITFNTVAIGLIDTGVSEKLTKEGEDLDIPQAEPQPVISMKRPGRPEEVASHVVFLASERASYVRKACIPKQRQVYLWINLRLPVRTSLWMEVGLVGFNKIDCTVYYRRS